MKGLIERWCELAEMITDIRSKVTYQHCASELSRVLASSLKTRLPTREECAEGCLWMLKWETYPEPEILSAGGINHGRDRKTWDEGWKLEWVRCLNPDGTPREWPE